MPSFRLKPEHAALLVVDIQERLCAAMERDALDRMLARTGAAVEGARALGVPVFVTEQYPQGLGRTHSLLKLKLGTFTPLEKMDFSAATPDVLSLLGDRKQVLLAGMETHICVFQTARDLAEGGREPCLLADAVLSRTEEDRRVGLELCRDAGARILTVESALFDMLGRAGTPEFKKVSAAVR
ncbi:isochorismatase family protein [Corallococcus praedator]|uniref:Isochorismatase family protein n=1 Tax=Corallococcus praedator TaxID=2316724 RepID=A0ABX9Q8C3_9BACT|nr:MULTISPECIES: isochorismatase family protein [Corallococcus]RKG99820.1 isochorismatase family protein [Corallococcus sp. CA047B]RKH28380.1 isochorismatase family protein [Corallococcus sp. CA031C]RKH93422.1 isochorismatase family protein [Corallococcus praedator]